MGPIATGSIRTTQLDDHAKNTHVQRNARRNHGIDAEGAEHRIEVRALEGRHPMQSHGVEIRRLRPEFGDHVDGRLAFEHMLGVLE